jgi:L-2,4-diaminobutyrate decarboxylase
MNEELQRLLAELERDAGAEAAAACSRLVVAYFASTREGHGRVSTARAPSELAARFDEPLPVHGRSLADVLSRLEHDVLPDVNRLSHPRAMGHQVSAPLAVAVWTEALAAALNQSAAVWEMSPIGTIVETQVVRWMCGLAGYGPEAGGTFTSGGTEATFAGLLAARQAARPDVSQRGMGPDPPVVVCGEHAHYAVARAVAQLGLGTDRIAVVPSRDFRMDAATLEQTLDALHTTGRQVMAVVATAGTTATGSFDDLDAIGGICAARDLWLHVDAAHGGSALLSQVHRHRLAGIQRARSIAWDPHKMMLMPLAASVVLVRDERDLEAAFSQHAPYLFQAGEDERSWDQGRRSFMCSRRVDALKVWVALQRFGTRGLGALYDHLCDTARLLYEAVLERPQFQALHAPESNIVCFRYNGDGSVPDIGLDRLNLNLRTACNRDGDAWITTTVLDGRRVLRATIMNARTTAGDVVQVLDVLESLAKSVRQT